MLSFSGAATHSSDMLRTTDMNLLDRIMAFESGELDEEQTIDFFQELIDSGLAWSLQGSYGRTAKSLIENGYCTP